MKALLLENISAVAVRGISRTRATKSSRRRPRSRSASSSRRSAPFRFSACARRRAISAAVLTAAPKLVAVGAFCIGVDKIDQAAASERGIAVFNDPHSNSRSVAELAMGEIIMLLRRTFQPPSRCIAACGTSRRRARMRSAG